MPLYLAGEADADRLLETDAFALLLGMLLDQQVPMERAFSAPAALKRRLGGQLDPHVLHGLEPERLRAAFAEKPALHRFPAAMAARSQQLASQVLERYGGDAAAIWTSAPDAETLFARLRELPGFGDQKARIFVALLAKRLHVRPAGWERVTGSFGEAGVFRSVADIDSPESLEAVRAFKRDQKAARKGLARLTGLERKAGR